MKKSKSKYNYLDAPKMSVNQPYYNSQRITVDAEEGEQLEIKSNLPIQVRINGGEWVDVMEL
jgi:hypothetical protein